MLLAARPDSSTAWWMRACVSGERRPWFRSASSSTGCSTSSTSARTRARSWMSSGESEKSIMPPGWVSRWWVESGTRSDAKPGYAEDQRGGEVLGRHAGQLGLGVGDLDLGKRVGVEAERPRAVLGAGGQQIGRRPGLARPHEHIPALGGAAGDGLDLADLLDRVDHRVRVGADADRDAALEDARRGEVAVAEVG